MLAKSSLLSWLRSLLPAPQAYPPAPDGLVLYSVGDIHGRLDCLQRAHALIDADVAAGATPREHAVEIYLGDYVDRGPQSKAVIDQLIARRPRAPMMFLRGNHEIMMQKFLDGQGTFEEWRNFGGLETLVSYGVDARGLLAAGDLAPAALAVVLPQSHRLFLAELENYCLFGHYCFVHAGLRPNLPLDKQTIDDLAWIREPFLSYSGSFGFVVVHGHTPVADAEFLPNRINIDTGAYVTNRLSVLRIDAAGASLLGEGRKWEKI